MHVHIRLFHNQLIKVLCNLISTLFGNDFSTSFYDTGCARNIVFFSQYTAAHPSPNTHCQASAILERHFLTNNIQPSAAERKHIFRNIL